MRGLADIDANAHPLPEWSTINYDPETGVPDFVSPALFWQRYERAAGRSRTSPDTPPCPESPCPKSAQQEGVAISDEGVDLVDLRSISDRTGSSLCGISEMLARSPSNPTTSVSGSASAMTSPRSAWSYFKRSPSSPAVKEVGGGS